MEPERIPSQLEEPLIICPNGLIECEKVLYRSKAENGTLLWHTLPHDYLFFSEADQKAQVEKKYFKEFREFHTDFIITNWRIIFEPTKAKPEFSQFIAKQPEYIRAFFDVKLANIAVVELNSSNQITLTTRFDGRRYRLAIQGKAPEAKGIEKLIRANCFFEKSLGKANSIDKSFTYQYRMKLEKGYEAEEGWFIGSSLLDQFQLMGDDLVAEDPGQNPERPFVVFPNEDFKVCATYPSVTLAPHSMSQQELLACSKFRSKNRMPTLTYYHKDTGCSIWRCSQPQTGLLGKSSKEDVKMLNEISLVNGSYQKLQVLDARPYTSALGNSIMGGGFESTSTYKNCVFRFENIDNIHAVSAAYRAMSAIAYDLQAFNDQALYEKRVQDSGYYQLVSVILKAANDVVQCILQKKNNVLIHCSDGWDRTAQMAALSQMMLDPRYRTIRGFCQLIDKDWIYFGHKFHQRLGLYDAKIDSQCSPIFLQFLDCVHQLLIRFPKHFEYSENLLLYTAFECQSGRFGTFFGNSEKERLDLEVMENTESIWKYVLCHDEYFRNEKYDASLTAPIEEIHEIESHELQEWAAYFYRYTPYGKIGQQTQSMSFSKVASLLKMANDLSNSQFAEKKAQRDIEERGKEAQSQKIGLSLLAPHAGHRDTLGLPELNQKEQEEQDRWLQQKRNSVNIKARKRKEQGGFLANLFGGCCTSRAREDTSRGGGARK